MRAMFLVVAVLALASCQSASKAKVDVASASTPQNLMELTHQTLVYECPKCQMDYDRAGECPMCKVALVATKVDYICPADDKPVEHSGKCPRCAANARVVKTAMAGNPSGSTGGN